MGKKLDFVFAWFLTNLTLLAGTVTNFLDIEELKSIHYDIDILEKPVLYGRPLHTEVVYLNSKFGQRYECQLPDVTDMGKVQEEEKTAAETGISDLLKPMELAPCLHKTKDWWTYEFCYGKHVRQFHLDNNKMAGEVITLGVFESEMDWDNKSHSAAKRHRLNRYHSHRYVNGSACDLTGKPREAEVRFLCAEDELDTLSRIDEPESCRYIITVHTMRICHHPYLKPPAKAKPMAILCFPLLMPAQYEKYMHLQMKHRYSKEGQAIDSSTHDVAGEDADFIDQDLEDSDDEGKDGDLELLEEHHLQGNPASSAQESVIPEGDVIDDGLGDIIDDDLSDPIDLDLNPEQVDEVVTAVMKGVQGALEGINSELARYKSYDEHGNEIKKKKSYPTGALEKLGKRLNDNEEDDDDDDFDDDIDDEKLDGEMEKLMKEDYLELTRQILELPVEDQMEAFRLAKLAKEIETSFENIEAVDRLLDKIEELHTEQKQLEADDSTQSTGDTTGIGGDGPVTVLETKHEEVVDEEGVSKVEDDDGDDDGEEKDDKEVEEDEEKERKKKDLEERLIDTVNQLIRQMKHKGIRQPSTMKAAQQSSASDDLSSRVRVRVTRVKLDKNQKASSEKELKFYDTEHRDLEEAISEHLEKSGLNTDGANQVELRILSYIPENWPDQSGEEEGFAILSEEESNYFKNMIFGLVMSNNGEEESRQNRLQRNYGFQWSLDSSDQDRSQAAAEDRMDQDEVQILIPAVGPKKTRHGRSGERTSDPDS